MINKQQIVDLLVNAEFEFWSHEQDAPSKKDLLVSMARYNTIAETLMYHINSEIELARQQGYDSAFVTWNKDSAEFYR